MNQIRLVTAFFSLHIYKQMQRDSPYEIFSFILLLDSFYSLRHFFPSPFSFGGLKLPIQLLWSRWISGGFMNMWIMGFLLGGCLDLSKTGIADAFTTAAPLLSLTSDTSGRCQ